MRNLWLLGVASLVVGWSVACGGDATTAQNLGGGGTATGGDSTGGSTGGNSTGGNSTGGSSAGGSSAGGMGGMFATPCDEACAKVDMCSGFPGACAAIDVDCSDANADCPAQCVNAADCAAITSLISQNPDPTLSSCLNACDPGQGGGGGTGGMGSPLQCGICTAQNCSTEGQACQGNAACQAYAQCAANCSTPTCEDDCLANNPSTESSDLAACICDNCDAQCVTCP